MALDPIHQSQLYLRRAGQLLRSNGLLPPERYRHEVLKGEALDRFFENGRRQIERLAADMEAYTGRSFAGRTALDFGCGMGRTALPLAARCDHVYGLDVSAVQIEEAERNARERGVENADWMLSERLPELAGRYDLVVSFWVFQHIPSREGERIFAEILRGLRPGGIGALHFTLRSEGLLELARRLDMGSVYLSMNSYSLNRLGRLLAAEGISDWHVKWATRRPSADATLLFRKGDGEAAEPALGD